MLGKNLHICMSGKNNSYTIKITHTPLKGHMVAPLIHYKLIIKVTTGYNSFFCKEKDILRHEKPMNLSLEEQAAWLEFEREGKGGFLHARNANGHARKEGGKRLQGDHCFCHPTY